MGSSRFWGRGALIAGVIAAGLLIALPPAVSAASPGHSGGAAVAAECKKGGWASLAPEDDPASPFRNQGACVSYIATGGEVGSATVSPHDATPAPGQPGECKALPPQASNGAEHSSGQSRHHKCKPPKDGSGSDD